MLELKNIHKEYPAGDNTVHALKGVSLEFRKNEFVSILGPSGCGKTTMLNIIGGLDHYSDGDLVINGKSTKDFTERDWDAYRNYSIGFVFQSYNLIPHQSVLQNVELALALSGVSKAERRERAKKALESVGLANQLSKKPSEMSGGQMQRVAIARALVNNPDIILADEPTGALDSETSVQVMDILKEVAKDRLVIMVTHNPDLAEQYSTRIVRMLDGAILEDSHPLTEEEKETERWFDRKAKEKEEEEATKGKIKRKKKPSMSFGTSFALSLKNLFTKKGRTMLTSFAGSIGIIGIALIYAVSQGMTNYINIVQEETLSSYPLMIASEHTDMGSMLQSFMDTAESSGDHDKDAVYEKNALYNLVETLNSQETKQNDLKSFKAYIDAEKTKSVEESETGLSTALSGVQYTYDFDLLVYTKNVDGTIIKSDAQALAMEMMAKYLGAASIGDIMSSIQTSGSSSMMSQMATSTGLWQEMLPGENGSLVNSILENQYELIDGSWPNDYNEVVLVVDENNELDDMTLYALGLKSDEEIDEIVDAALNKTPLPETTTKKWSFEEIRNMKFRTALNGSCYQQVGDIFIDLRDTQQGMSILYENGLDIKVAGIIRPKEDTLSPMLKGSIGYTYKLTEYVVEQNKTSAAIAAQLATPNVDIFTGLPFEEGGSKMTAAEKEADFREYVATLNTAGKADAYIKIMSIMPEDQLNAAVAQALANTSQEQIIDQMVTAMVAQTGMSEEQIRGYIEQMDAETLNAMITQAVAEQVKAGYAAGVKAQLSTMTDEQLAGAFDLALPTYTTEQCATYYSEVLTFSTSTYDSNLRELGYVDLDTPSSVSLYASSFTDKGVIEDAIKAYNKTVPEESQISYTD